MKTLPKTIGPEVKLRRPGGTVWTKLKRQHLLLWMSVPIILHLILFQFVPLWGWLMAFKDYHVGQNLMKAEWVGLRYFRELMEHDDFRRALRNTLVMNLMSLGLGTFCAVGLAVILNELKNKAFVRTVQTMTYLPHFVSMVVVANIAVMLLSPDGGVLNNLLLKTGVIDTSIFFFSKGDWFWVIHTLIVTWKGFGWSAIIYLSAIAGIDPSLYDAAKVDGAGRWGRVRYIVLPGITPTIILMLILSVGNVVTGGFESQYLLGNAIVQEHSEVLSILALRLGLSEGNFSLGTAVGIFNSVVGLTLLLLVNSIARRYKNNLF